MLVLDFDGNLTDGEAEGKPFVKAYLADLAQLLGRSLAELRPQADAISLEIASDPTTGWRYGGQIMAPSSVDPYLRTGAVAQLLLKRAGWSDADIETTLQRLFQKNYALTLDVPRDGVFDLLVEAWMLSVHVRIVTNSTTDAVTRKVRNLLTCGQAEQELIGWWQARVIGDARKHDPNEKPEVGALWDGMAESVQFEGFPRRTWIKRPHYRRVLERLQTLEAPNPDGTKIEKYVVVGDVFEFDCALPLMMDWHVGLMASDRTPPWEIDFVSSHPRGRVLREVSEILPYYNEVQSRAA